MSETATRTLTESDIQRGLRDLIEHLGFTCSHTRYSIGSDPGFPDLVCVRHDGKMIVAEVKGPKGRIRPEQIEWLHLFRSVPGCVFAEIVGAAWTSYDEALELIQEAVALRTTRAEAMAGSGKERGG